MFDIYWREGQHLDTHTNVYFFLMAEVALS